MASVVEPVQKGMTSGAMEMLGAVSTNGIVAVAAKAPPESKSRTDK
ncbi:hypothetical protein [Aestuariivirga sp.]